MSRDSLVVAPDAGVALTFCFQALQGQSITGSDSVSAKLHQILRKSAEVGATLNNGNVEKALVAGLPFWGVNLPLLRRKQRTR